MTLYDMTLELSKHASSLQGLASLLIQAVATAGNSAMVGNEQQFKVFISQAKSAQPMVQAALNDLNAQLDAVLAALNPAPQG